MDIQYTNAQNVKDGAIRGMTFLHYSGVQRNLHNPLKSAYHTGADEEAWTDGVQKTGVLSVPIALPSSEGFSMWKMQSCSENTYICSLSNVRRTAVTSSVQIICCWRPLAQYCLHGTLRSSSCIRAVVQVQNDRRPRAVPRHGYE